MELAQRKRKIIRSCPRFRFHPLQNGENLKNDIFMFFSLIFIVFIDLSLFFNVLTVFPREIDDLRQIHSTYFLLFWMFLCSENIFIERN